MRRLSSEFVQLMDMVEDWINVRGFDLSVLEEAVTSAKLDEAQVLIDHESARTMVMYLLVHHRMDLSLFSTHLLEVNEEVHGDIREDDEEFDVHDSDHGPPHGSRDSSCYNIPGLGRPPHIGRHPVDDPEDDYPGSW